MNGCIKIPQKSHKKYLIGCNIYTIIISSTFQFSNLSKNFVKHQRGWKAVIFIIKQKKRTLNLPDRSWLVNFQSLQIKKKEKQKRKKGGKDITFYGKASLKISRLILHICFMNKIPYPQQILLFAPKSIKPYVDSIVEISFELGGFTIVK